MTVKLTDAETDRGDEAFRASWEQWHAAHETALADPHGFLAVTGLHWLSDEPQRFAGAPGSWTTGPDGVTVVLDAGEELLVDGLPLAGTHRFDPIPERVGINARSGDAVIEIARRGGHDIVRPRHPEHPLRTQFSGTPSYDPDPRWVVTGRYLPFDAPRPTTVGAAVDDLQHVYDAPGRVVFELGGREQSLTAFPGHEADSLVLLFTDETSGVTTYAANRALQVRDIGADGELTLDFNRATNLPCAYTDFATCPLPPAENRLPVAVEAGEQIPRERG
jgi:uncharacterized protein (DUF1684 family)